MVEDSGMSPLMVASPMSAVAWGIKLLSEQVVSDVVGVEAVVELRWWS